MQVQEKEAAGELPVKESSEDSALGGMRTRETEWGQELAKTIASTIAGMATNTRPVALGTVAESRPSPRVTGKRECAKTYSVSLGRKQLLVMNKHIVKDKCLVRQGSGHGVNATEAVTAIAAGASSEHKVRAKEVPMLHRWCLQSRGDDPARASRKTCDEGDERT